MQEAKIAAPTHAGPGQIDAMLVLQNRTQQEHTHSTLRCLDSTSGGQTATQLLGQTDQRQRSHQKEEIGWLTQKGSSTINMIGTQPVHSAVTSTCQVCCKHVSRSLPPKPVIKTAKSSSHCQPANAATCMLQEERSPGPTICNISSKR